MDQLTFGIAPEGLIVEALIGPDGDRMNDLRAAGQPIPAPLQGRALIDTGTDISAVDPGILKALGLAPFDRVNTRTVGGQVTVNRYMVSLSIFGPAHVAGDPVLLRTQWTVMELPTPLPGITALFGMDLLAECRLIVDGPARQFTLEF